MPLKDRRARKMARRLSKYSSVMFGCGLFLLAVASIHYADAQRISAVSSGRVSDAAPSMRAGTIARVPGGERAGSFATADTTSRLATGKSAGYGNKLTLGSIGEMAPIGGPASFGLSRDFPDTDFVATMPKPSFYAETPGENVQSKNGFGLTLSVAGNGAYGNASAGAGNHVSVGSHPASHLKSADTILNPFTRAPSRGFGSMPSTSVGSLK